MKKIFLILLIAISVSNTLKAQSGGVSDTLAYLQTILTNKSQFIGQPFSSLLDTLQIQIKYFSSNTRVHDKSKETDTHFGFRFPQNADEIYLTYPGLEISWAPYLDANQSDILWENNNGGGWSSAAANFYNNSIIADIRLIQ